MNSNVGRRICAHLWETATPSFISGAARRASNRASIRQFSVHGAARRTFTRFSYTHIFGIPPKSSKYIFTRSFASGGFFALGTSPGTAATEAVVTTCTNTVEKGLCPIVGLPHRGGIGCFVQSTWRRNIHNSCRPEAGGERNIGPAIDGKINKKRVEDNSKGNDGNNSAGKSPSTAPAAASGVERSAQQQILDRLPHLPNLSQYHRPTKDELLAAATGFWARLKVRFKWFSIRSVRPYNMDDISAFISWVLLGHVIWIIVGTTTFFSLAILAVNTVFAQETLAKWIGNYLTKSSGITVVFESAVVPKWKNGVITLSNVFVSRRPGHGNSKVSKGSSTTAAAASSGKPDEAASQAIQEQEDDTNITQFDLAIDIVNVTLSFAKWWDGRGLLKDVEVKGVRGVLDRTGIKDPTEYVDPKTYRHEHQSGDFELDSFKMEDLLITVHQPNGFRPFPISVYSCELPLLRKQYLFYDFLSANTMNGSIDGSLFTIHPRQTHNYTGAQLTNGVETNGEASLWKKHSRLRIDGLNIDHLNRGISGPFSWIYEGNVDIIADIMFPAESHDSIAKVMSDFYDRMEAMVTSNRLLDHDDDSEENVREGRKEETLDQKQPASKDDDKRFVVIDLRLHLNDVRASVPIFTKDISLRKNALVRPIVAYINSHRTFIPVTCRLVKRASDFDGSWTPFDSGLMDDLSAETYEAFARGVMDDQARMRRFKKVGLWSLQLAVQALFMGMAGNIA